MATRTSRPRTWLVTGGTGLLGRDTVDLLRGMGVRVLAPPHAELDIADAAGPRAYLAEHRPAVVVNCAAYTAVDAAEADEAAALRVNGEGARRLAEASREFGARLVHVSTDYVFAGDARTPYTEDAPTGPVCAYGRTKLAGEIAVSRVLAHRSAIARTGWLYGAHRRGFVNVMVERAAKGEPIEAVDDQVGQPTWSAGLAGRIVALGRNSSATGIFHATNTGQATWFDLAREIYGLLGADPGLVKPVSGRSLNRPAPRPPYTVLSQDRWAQIGLRPMCEWRAAVRGAVPVLRDRIDG